jgi:citrate lyase subunit beta/citryl-CoA lyase
MANFIPIAPLMVSTDNNKHISKIETLKTDTIILNLEDGVGDKEKALENSKAILKDFDRKNKKFVVRVNALNDGGIKEILELNEFHPDAVRVPKIRVPEDVSQTISLVGQGIDIHLSIETREAWLNLAQLRIDERVTTFYLGILDLFADLELQQDLLSPTNEVAKYLLSHFLVTSKAIGVTPVSFVYQDYKNHTTFMEWLKLEASMGYRSKGALSPTQANEINRYLGFTAEEIERAKEIKTLFEESRLKGVCGFSNDKYGFIDEPIYKGALGILRSLQ